MTPPNTLKLASIAFAVLWALGMFVLSDDHTILNFVMLMVAGTLAGIGWYYAMKWFQAHPPKRTPDNR